MEKEAASIKTNKILQSLNPTAKRQNNGKRSWKSKNKRNPLKAEPDGLKPKGIKWENKLQV